LAGIGVLAAAAQAGGTPEQLCQAAKNKTAGKYGVCRQSAEAKLVTSGDMLKYTQALDKCESKFSKAWQKAIAKATAASVACLDAPLSEEDFQAVIDEHTGNIATALGGGGLSDCSADLATCGGDLDACTTDLGTCAAGLGTCSTSLGDCQSCQG
jgi:hypothetical protein